MTYISRALRAGAVAVAAAVLTSGAYGASQLPATPASGLKAPTVRKEVTPIPCNSIAACNSVIALCAAGNGKWLPDGREGPEGQPAGGICYLP